MTDRFVVSTNEIGRIIVTDVETGTVYHHDNLSHFLGLIRLLNELNDDNNELKKENEQLKKRLEHYAKVEALNGDGTNERL